MPPLRDLAGQRFGRLIAERPAERRNGHVTWRCHCACGATVSVVGSRLTNGESVSCGCFKRERLRRASTVHGLAGRGRVHPLYWIWQAMIQRCTNPRKREFRHYGGRGITVCNRWREDFTAFLADVGERPTAQHSIDRIDNDGNYEPANVRWATRSEQNSNQRRFA